MFYLQSERNDAFYDQPGVQFHYPKYLIYPKEGGEVSLEQIKASLPQYCPLFPDEREGEEEGVGEDDMDLTMAGGGNISTHNIGDFFRPEAKQLLQKPNTGRVLVTCR